jgi:hypothetical protein
VVSPQVPGIYVVNLLSQPTAPVRVLLQSDSSAVRVSPSALVFTPGAYAIPRIVTVSAVGSLSGISQTTIKHVVESADPAYNGMRVPNVIVVLAGLASSSSSSQASAPAQATRAPAAVQEPAAQAPEAPADAPADAPAEPAACLGILPVNLRLLEAVC